MIAKLRIKDPSDFVFCHLIKLPEVKDCSWVLKHEVPVKDVSFLIKSSLLYAFQFSPSLIV